MKTAEKTMKPGELTPPCALPAFQKIRDRAEALWHELWHGGKTVILVGGAACGRAAGALAVLEAFENEAEEHKLDCHIVEAGCMGYCYAEPVVIIRKPGYPAICYQHVTTAVVTWLVKLFLLGDDPCAPYALGAFGKHDEIPAIDDLPRAKYQKRIVLENCGLIDPLDIGHYVATGGYAALAKALLMRQEEVVAEVKRSGLRGRGGAGFPTGQKWEACRNAPGKTKYVFCNADEGDPGAFLDRTILESDPHSVIEGMIIAGCAVAARHGCIYVRAEYPLAVQRVKAAIRQAEELNLLGENILGSGFSFDITVFEGAGAFICGEETALIASMEGSPGIPRHRPPYPAREGLNGKPTLINNVKTFAYIRHIIDKGADWFAGIGTKGSTGTAVFALAGKVRNTGLIEVPMGTTLRQIIVDIGGGVEPGYIKEKDPRGLMLYVEKEKSFKAVQIGGPSGGCLPGQALDLPVDFDSLKQAGAMMGSGSMIVLDEDDCMVELARYFLEFTQKESCGKCTFCRLGTRQMLEMLTDFTNGKGSLEDLEVLEQLALDVKAGSLCSLGKTAPNPVLTSLRYFRDEYEAHITEQRCPSLSCKGLIAFSFLDVRCRSFCGDCCEICDAITTSFRWDGLSSSKIITHAVNHELCTRCALCLDTCVAINHHAVLKISPISKELAESYG